MFNGFQRRKTSYWFTEKRESVQYKQQNDICLKICMRNLSSYGKMC